MAYHGHIACGNVVEPCINSQGEPIPPCGSLDTQGGLHEATCLVCGRLTNLATGLVVPLEEQFTACGL